MLGWGKKKASASDLVAAFVLQVRREVAEETLLTARFLELLRDNGISNSRIDELLQKQDVKLVWVCMFCAVDALAIQNCFKPPVASGLYNQLHLRLQTEVPHKNLGDQALKVVDQIRSSFVAGVPPTESVSRAVMDMLDFPASADTAHLYNSPTFHFQLGTLLLSAGPAFWKRIAEEYAVVV